jgi:phosphatidylglycerophosphatase A
VTLGGAGLLPLGPGTWGSALTCLIIWMISRAAPVVWVLLAGLLIFSALCVALGGWAQTFFERKDPGPVVLDEAAGICLTLLAVPLRHALAWILLLGFVAFRVFDITKPPPARQLERLPEGWGILMDDLAAAVYANLVCQLVYRWVWP